MPAMRGTRVDPYVLIADVRAASSLLKTSWPAEAHMPSSKVVLVLIAAGMAAIGELVVPLCCKFGCVS